MELQRHTTIVPTFIDAPVHSGDSPSVPKVYWDSCVFLSLIEATPERIATIEFLVNEAETGRLEIWTSLFTIAEVAYIKRSKDPIVVDASAQSKIDKLWMPGSVFKMMEPHLGIMVSSAAIVRDARLAGFGLQAKDSIHLATAKECGITQLHPYDGFNKKWGQVRETFGINVSHPKTERPSVFDPLDRAQ